jgi:hypothetical protein
LFGLEDKDEELGTEWANGRICQDLRLTKLLKWGQYILPQIEQSIDM